MAPYSFVSDFVKQLSEKKIWTSKQKYNLKLLLLSSPLFFKEIGSETKMVNKKRMSVFEIMQMVFVGPYSYVSRCQVKSKEAGDQLRKQQKQ